MSHAIRRLGLHAAVFACLAALIVLPLGPATAVAQTAPDYAVEGGWFFTQTGGGEGKGFAVLDAGNDASGRPIRFWFEFRRLGGADTLGYPIGQRYVGSDGFTYQPFQRGILQWRPELDGALLSNTFQSLESASKDDWLLTVKGVPKPIADDGSGGDFQKAVATRLGWLTNEQIKAKFLANPNPGAIPDWSDGRALELYGLPMSQPEKHGPFIAQRFQRGALQLWVEEVAGMPSVGSVVGILGGDLMKEAGLLPASALQVQGPGGTPIVQATPVPTPAAPTYSWQLKQTATYPNCGTTYFTVRALNADGSGVNGLTIRSWNDSGNLYEESTREREGDGYADRVISAGASAGRWYVMLVDGQGRQSSNVATINFTATCDPNAGAVNQIALELREGGAPPPAPAASAPPQSQPAPSPAPTSFSWRISQVGAFPNCGTTYVRALVRDAGGNGLNGMTLKSWNDAGNEYIASTRFHNGNDGYWDRIVSTGPSAGKWYVALIDGQGRQSSNVATVNFTGSCDPNTGAVQEVALEVRPN